MLFSFTPDQLAMSGRRFVLTRTARHPFSALLGIASGFADQTGNLPLRDRLFDAARSPGCACDWFDFVTGWPLRQSTRRAYILDTLWSD